MIILDFLEVMLKYDRQTEIITILKSKKMCSVNDLCEQVYASVATIRRDIRELEEKGLVRSFYGGVSIIEKNKEALFDDRKVTLELEKEEIAKVALQLIQNDQFIFMDSSTTCLTLGKKMNTFKNIQILTNGLETLRTLHKTIQNPLYSTGGKLNSHSMSMLGNAAHNQILNYNADIFFCSCRGLSSHGPCEPSQEEAQIKKCFSKRARLTVLLCDDSKFDVNFSHISLEFNEIDMIITNKPLPPHLAQKITLLNPRIVLKSPGL